MQFIDVSTFDEVTIETEYDIKHCGGTLYLRWTGLGDAVHNVKFHNFSPQQLQLLADNLRDLAIDADLAHRAQQSEAEPTTPDPTTPAQFEDIPF